MMVRIFKDGVLLLYKRLTGITGGLWSFNTSTSSPLINSSCNNNRGCNRTPVPLSAATFNACPLFEVKRVCCLSKAWVFIPKAIFN